MKSVQQRLRDLIAAIDEMNTINSLLEQAANKIALLEDDNRRLREEADKAWQIAREAAWERDRLRREQHIRMKFYSESA